MRTKSAVALGVGVVSLYVAADFLTAAAGEQMDSNLHLPPAASVSVASSTTTLTTTHAIAYNTITDEQHGLAPPTDPRVSRTK